MHSLTLRSYAKINIGLMILKKREDGYHDIATVFQQIDLHDEITYEKTASDFRITSTDPLVPLDQQNLVYQSYNLFRKTHGLQGGLKIHIKKNIPMGSGLGGGSSNAAATLVAIDRLWETKLPHTDLHKMAIQIGSDVPFFLVGGTAQGEGRGEILTPFLWPDDWWVVLVCPGFQVSTSWAYGQARIALTKEEKFTKFKSIFNRHLPHALLPELRNEFEGMVFQRHPILRELKERFYERDAFYASMSGSGATVYGLYKSRPHAEDAEAFFSKMEGITTFLCRTMRSHSGKGNTSAMSIDQHEW
jgi:4-diphosphocytidyl-2-C-methyl-D-erythritol kinase